jgi:hypothetical protein
MRQGFKPLLDCRTVELSNCRTVELSHCRTVALSDLPTISIQHLILIGNFTVRSNRHQLTKSDL